MAHPSKKSEYNKKINKHIRLTVRKQSIGIWLKRVTLPWICKMCSAKDRPAAVLHSLGRT